MIEDKRIVVTGGAGFIGSHIVEALHSRNDVIVLDDFSTGKEQNILGLGGIMVLRGSVTQPKHLAFAFRNADMVFHLAARPSVQESISDPLGTEKVNLTGTLNVLQAARDAGVGKLVFSSSCAVYGDARPPIGEDAALRPMSPYAVQKLAAEHYCRLFHEPRGMRTVCLRYFNVFGPRQDPGSQYAAVVPVFFQDMARNSRVTVFGDGRQTRDFIYVGDVVGANMLAAESSGADGGVVNIATGRPTSVMELARTVAGVVGKPLKIKRASARKGDIRHSAANISRARRLLGFAPAVGLEQGLGIFSTAL